MSDYLLFIDTEATDLPKNWALPFDSRFKQGTPFVDLFSKTGGKYLVRPSQVAIDLWDDQVQLNDFAYDQRGKFTYQMEGGMPVIKKHIYNSPAWMDICQFWNFSWRVKKRWALLIF